jgi:hypothetical protein
MQITEILRVNYPGALYIQTGEDYEGLDWKDESTKPTKAKLESEWAGVKAKLEAEEQAKIDAKASAISKLQALGLTVEEVEVAFGLSE